VSSLKNGGRLVRASKQRQTRRGLEKVHCFCYHISKNKVLVTIASWNPTGDEALNAYGSEGRIYERYNQQYFSPTIMASIMQTIDEFFLRGVDRVGG